MESIKKKLEDLGIQFSESYYKGSSFLLDDGTYCNLAQQPKWLDNDHPHKIVAHHMLDKFIEKENIIKEEDKQLIDKYNKVRKPFFIICLQERILRYTDGACTINDGTNLRWENCYIDLPLEMPKGKQLEKLILWIDDRHYKNPSEKRKLEVSYNDKMKSFNLDYDSTDDIIKEIRKFYVE